MDKIRTDQFSEGTKVPPGYLPSAVDNDER